MALMTVFVLQRDMGHCALGLQRRIGAFRGSNLARILAIQMNCLRLLVPQVPTVV